MSAKGSPRYGVLNYEWTLVPGIVPVPNQEKEARERETFQNKMNEAISQDAAGLVVKKLDEVTYALEDVKAVLSKGFLYLTCLIIGGLLLALFLIV